MNRIIIPKSGVSYVQCRANVVSQVHLTQIIVPPRNSLSLDDLSMWSIWFNSVVLIRLLGEMIRVHNIEAKLQIK